MRNTRLNILGFLLLITGLNPTFAQTEILIDGTNRIQSTYQGNSFKYLDEVILKPGFTVSAATSGAWYAKPNSYNPNNSPEDLHRNFVRTETILNSGVTNENQISSLSPFNKSTVYEYKDDIGRPLQKINMRNSPSMGDVIQYFSYDAWGRQPNEYLPYTYKNFETSGSFRVNAGGKTGEQRTFYTNTAAVASDTVPYKSNSFDNSPLNQLKQVYGSGALWQSNLGNRSTKSTITTNTAAEAIKQFTYAGTGYPQLTTPWADNTLQVSESVDEENHIKRSYKNFRDQLILERTGDGTVWHDTYYVYDIMGNVAFVFPPEAIVKLADYSTNNATFANNWCFQYQYDDYQRLTAKRIPGMTDWVYMIYDQWDRLVLTQSPNQRATNQWTFTKFDIFNRPVLTGFTNGARTTLTAMAASNTVRYETRQNNSIGYTNVAFPAHTENDLLTITYYDDYSFITYTSWNDGSGNYDFVSESGFSQSSDLFLTVKGQTTGSKIKVVNQGVWLNSVMYYDNKYRIVQTLAENYLGGIDRVTNQYDFSGKVLKKYQVHDNGVTSLTLLNEFEYDHAGRVLNVFQQIDNEPKVLVMANHYNELGQIIEKNLHSIDNGLTFLQSVDYRYNIRGMLTNINNSTLTNDGVNNNDTGDLFGMDFIYNQEQIYVNGSSTLLYNGNISAVRWKWNNLTDAPVEKAFKYDYDTWNRLKESYYANKNGNQWNGTLGGYDESMTYDNNGNVLSINRTGKIGSSNPTIDNLAYKFTGNQLANVYDNSPYYNTADKNPDYGFAENIHDVNITEYRYDANGNLIEDDNKGILSVTYNHLDMPERIELESSRIIEYTYDASGNKLRKIVKIGTTEVSRTDYVGCIHYVDNQLAFLLTDEGRLVKRNTGYDYEYFLRDHQGNMRVVFGKIHQTDMLEATLEPELNTKETTDFKNITRGTGYNHTEASAEIPSPQYAAVLNGGVGPAKILSVKPGDKLSLDVFARYTGTVSSSKLTAAALASAVTTAFQVIATGETQTAYNAVNGGVLGSPAGENSGAPKAYLYYFLFSADYTWYQFGVYPVSTNAAVGFEELHLDLTVSLPLGVTDGFVYTYVANETIGTSVYFDDFKIIHEKTNTAVEVLQASDYYPFGLTINPLSYRKETIDFARTKNDYAFQKQELQNDFGLSWYQYKYRMHDPAIGRFGGVDPLSEKYYYNSVYAFSENRLTDGIELEGAEFSSSSLIMPMGLTPMPTIPNISKFEYTGGWMDYISAIDNGVINILNTPINIWNVFAGTNQSIYRGTVANDISQDFSNTYNGIKNYAVGSWNYTINTPVSQQFIDAGLSLVQPQTLETLTTFYVGYKLPEFSVPKFTPQITGAPTAEMQLLTRAAQKAEIAVGGTGRFAGTAKHTYASNLLGRYQSMFGNKGLEFNQYFNGTAGKGFLDVVNHQSMIIYDFKFGDAFMSTSQRLKYSNSFPGYSIEIVRPFK